MSLHAGLTRLVVCVGTSAVLCTPSVIALADYVHLEGGRVLEGKVEQRGDQVTIELESGTISLPAADVKQIERRESDVERFERRYAQLRADDVSGRMELADFCRSRDMRARELKLLREVLARDPEHARARARLGYVRGPNGWITLDEQKRAQGFVQRDGVWMSSERALELERLKEQVETAKRERERAQLALEAEELALRAKKLEQERNAAAEAASKKDLQNDGSNSYWPVIGAGYPIFPVRGPYPRPGRGGPGPVTGGGFPSMGPFPEIGPFPIPGVREPRDMSFPLNGVPNPENFLYPLGR